VQISTPSGSRQYRGNGKTLNRSDDGQMAVDTRFVTVNCRLTVAGDIITVLIGEETTMQSGASILGPKV
jgi:hypothetical protein